MCGRASYSELRPKVRPLPREYETLKAVGYASKPSTVYPSCSRNEVRRA
jgi:hypothetical protein